MATMTLDPKNFRPSVQREGITLVDWWASWCGPCRTFAPIYERSSELHPEVLYGKIDTEKEQELAGAFGISSIPTLMLFRDGILLFNQAGALPLEALEDLIKQAQALDMDRIREEVKAASAERT